MSHAEYYTLDSRLVYLCMWHVDTRRTVLLACYDGVHIVLVVTWSGGAGALRCVPKSGRVKALTN